MKPAGGLVRAPEGLAAAPTHPELTPLLSRIAAYDVKADPTTVAAAYDIAFHAHEAQKRDNGEPYITHPLAVATILAGYRRRVLSGGLVSRPPCDPGSFQVHLVRGRFQAIISL